jgi:hypothetical protein
MAARRGFVAGRWPRQVAEEHETCEVPLLAGDFWLLLTLGV